MHQPKKYIVSSTQASYVTWTYEIEAENEDEDDARQRMSKVISIMTQKHGFYAAKAMSAKIEICDDSMTSTGCTDGEHIWVNAGFVMENSIDVLIGLVCEECQHIYNGHTVRRGDRDSHTWNEAIDYSISPFLKAFGLDIGEMYYDAKYAGMVAEAIYTKLISEQQEQKKKGNPNQPCNNGGGGAQGGNQQSQSKPQQQDGKANGGAKEQPGSSPGPGPGSGKTRTIKTRDKEGNSITKEIPAEDYGKVIDQIKPDGSALSKEEQIQKADYYQMQAQQALVIAKACGSVPGEFENLIKKMLEPVIDYDGVILRAFMGDTPDDYSYARPNKRWLGCLNLIYPGITKSGAGVIAIWVDTSGSVSDTEFRNFIGIVNNVLPVARPTQLIFIQGDRRTTDVTEYTEYDTIEEIKRKGYGGTSFVPFFQYLEDNHIKPDQAIVLTDLEVGRSEFPNDEPDYPVLFLSTNKEWAPWGRVVKFNPAKD